MKRVSALGPLLESSLRRGKRLQSTATQEESSHPPPARELNFCTHFLVEESENLFGELLQEAVHKHNIHPYIAHQLPPVLQPDLVIDTYQRNCVPLHSTSSNAAAESSQILTDEFKKKLIGDDPVPPVYLNRKQKEWFSTVVTKKLLPYTPTHDPPPLRSTGNKFMSSNLYLEEGESKIRYYKNSDFNDFNLRLMAVNTHKKVPRNFITLAAPDPTVLRSDRHVLSEAAVHAISNGIIRGQIANIHDCDYYCGACGKGFVRYETAQKHLMTRHHNLYLPQEMSLNRKGGTESGKEEAIEKAYLLPTGLLQVHYHLLKHEKAEGSMDRLPEENATTSTKQETTEAKEEPKTKVKLSAVASLATVKLPTESFIDEILISVWDEVAIDREDLFKDSKEKYFAFSDTVVEAASKSSLPDNTRKRTTMRDGDGSATAVKTTPDNVAPAIKNRRDHFDRQSPHTPAAARRSVKEKRKDYPNPFGEYGSGIVQEEVVELDREPVNPFCGVGGGGEADGQWRQRDPRRRTIQRQQQQPR
ncbi:hypothetical protein ADEAN_000018300 [Angomonas deanei]|uniref:C2H2-type domain-containing protein n=1 Tax=Angomonas deanei TaxID=59799 RepID=A0A7G2C0Q9_9TRYP|nr:hypothetical protein ADEAN_000018300 [Angomonas deanei]